MATEFFLPKMTDHMESGVIVNWLVKEGDPVEKGQPILEIETDKATVELEAPASGILRAIRPGVAAGATVPVGETIAYIGAADEKIPALSQLAGTETERKPEYGETRPASTGEPNGDGSVQAEHGRPRAVPAVRRLAKDLGIDLARVPGTGPEGRITEKDVRAFVEQQKVQTAAADESTSISPLARKMAAELGVDLSRVKGTGPGGRITKEDVQAFVQGIQTVPPSTETVIQPGAGIPSEEEEVDWVNLTTIQRLTGQRMVESLQSAPQFSLTIQVDMTHALQFRQAQMDRVKEATGESLSMTGILVKVVALALKRYPRANASFDNGRVKLHKQVNIGVAVGSNDGLVVPVIKDADQESLIKITRMLKAFQEKASRMRFAPDDLSGSTFTISNLGMYGIDQFNAIINPPESAILAVGRIVKIPVGLPDDSIALRPVMNLTLTVDHRSMDGMQGAQFLSKVKELLEQPYLLVN